MGLRMVGHRAAALALFAFVSLFANAGAAQEWAPTRPMRLIVPFPPGGTADLLGRLLGQHLSDALGQPVVIENRGGAGTLIATEMLIRSAPDGYTIGLIASPHASNATLAKNLPFNPISDIQPMTLVGRTSLLLVVHPGVKANTVQELVALSKSTPGSIQYGSSGAGMGNQIAGELLKLKTQADLVHVPYRGGGPAMNDLVAGQIAMMFNAFASTLPLVQAGKFRALAITGAKRSPILPDVPTMAEAGVPDLEIYEWFGLVGPAGMPPEAVKRIHAETIRFLQRPDIKTRMVDQGVEMVEQTPDQFRDFIRQEIERYRDIIVRANIQAQ
ncbi:MAG: tripartite tricarboxylate transporter substrate binding protein [Xanthobacteraceae bacterium]